ncbi:MAG: hypothetical protein Q7T99_18340 [Pseudomonas sp.]|nr:hypothetical protein [Pseudomonas sp.]
MMMNPQRLPLLTEIGLLAAQASVYSELDKLLPSNPALDPDDDPRYTLTSDLWLEVRNGVISLAKMDHRDEFTPKNSPLLSEYGLLKEYRRARWELEDEHIHPEYY